MSAGRGILSLLFRARYSAYELGGFGFIVAFEPPIWLGVLLIVVLFTTSAAGEGLLGRLTRQAARRPDGVRE